MTIWTWFCRPKTDYEKHVRNAYALLKQNLTSGPLLKMAPSSWYKDLHWYNLQEIFTAVGRVEATLALPSMAILINTLATKNKFHDEPDQHKEELFFLAFEGLFLVLMGGVGALDAGRKYVEKCGVNVDTCYKYLGYAEGAIGYFMMYMMADALQNEEKEIFDRPDHHRQEIFLLVMKLALYCCASGVFTVEILHKMHDYFKNHEKAAILKSAALPDDICRKINAAIGSLNKAHQFETPYQEIKTYQDLESWSEALENEHPELSKIINDYLASCQLTEAEVNDENTLLIKSNSRTGNEADFVVSDIDKETKGFVLGINYH